MENIEKLESRLWEAADQLRANSKLTSTEYYMPVLGLIFLRHAYNRFLVVEEEIKARYSYLICLLADQEIGSDLNDAFSKGD